MARAMMVLAVLLTMGGCVADNDKGSDVASTPSPKRYDVDPDKPKRVCEATTEGTESKTICY